jgi:hypothetical protein
MSTPSPSEIELENLELRKELARLQCQVFKEAYQREEHTKKVVISLFGGVLLLYMISSIWGEATRTPEEQEQYEQRRFEERNRYP